MIFWLVLFALIIAISFVLALQSMRDYQEIPQKPLKEYGLFLIRRLENFESAILSSLLQHISDKNLIISFERLFKGKKTALTVFGPKAALQKFSKELDLLELEDYTLMLESENTSVWEVGLKNTKKFNPVNINNIFSNLPQFEEEDQFFWQVILGKDQIQIRAALHSQKADRKKVLAPLLQNLTLGTLVKVPRPFSNEQMMSFYKLRSLGKDSRAPELNSEGVISLLKFS